MSAPLYLTFSSGKRFASSIKRCRENKGWLARRCLMRNGARLKPARIVSPSISNSLGIGASSEAGRSRLAICKSFLLYISITVNFHMPYVISHMAYGSPSQEVSAENPPIAPLQQRDRRDHQISLTLASADHQSLNRAAISPQVIDHETIRVGARVHPFDLRPFVQQTDILQLQEHAGRVARVLLIECDLEGEGTDAGQKVEFVGDRAAVKT